MSIDALRARLVEIVALRKLVAKLENELARLRAQLERGEAKKRFQVGDVVCFAPDPPPTDERGVIASGPTPADHAFPGHWLVKWNNSSHPGLFPGEQLYLVRRVIEGGERE